MGQEKDLEDFDSKKMTAEYNKIISTGKYEAAFFNYWKELIENKACGK